MNTPASPSSERWVLGFDGSCQTCTVIGQMVNDIAGDRLESANLRSPELVSWRSRVLPSDAPWLPTLFRAEHGHVEAWTGAAMVGKLTQLLGPVKAVRLARAVGQSAVNPEVAHNLGRRQVLKAMIGSGAAGALIALGKTPVLASVAGLNAQPSGVSVDGDGNQWRIALATPDVVDRLASHWSAQTGLLAAQAIERQGVGPLADVRYISVFRNGAHVRDVAFQAFGMNSEDWGVYLSFEETGRVLEHAADFRIKDQPVLYSFTNDGALRQVNPEDEMNGDEPQPVPFASACSVCQNTCNFIVYNWSAGQTVSCSVACTAASGGVGIFLCVAVCAVLGAFGAEALSQLGCPRACSPLC